MPARRALRVLSTVESAEEAQRNAHAGGKGLDWDDEPEELLPHAWAISEWRRLAVEYRDFPTRFREGERQGLIEYCSMVHQMRKMRTTLLESQALMRGRGHGAEDTLVKNPLYASASKLRNDLRLMMRELGLTPDSRHRIGMDEATDPDLRWNPFA